MNIYGTRAESSRCALIPPKYVTELLNANDYPTSSMVVLTQPVPGKKKHTITIDASKFFKNCRIMSKDTQVTLIDAGTSAVILSGEKITYMPKTDTANVNFCECNCYKAKPVYF